MLLPPLVGDKVRRHHLDPRVWKAFAGSARLPAVGSVVYFFPQGYAEQAFSPPDLKQLSSAKPYFLCRITAVKLHASAHTDEVYATISLNPGAGTLTGSEESSSESPLEDEGVAAVRSFPKVLTPSDANNGGGFSVPRFCAENVFPKLDTSSRGRGDPPVQLLTVRDVHGAVWRFRHIFRGTPRRHLLTTGWSKFVSCKKLIAGDTVVFVRNCDGQLFVGVHRSVRPSSVVAPSTVIKYTSRATGAEIKIEEDAFLREGYWRSVRGRVAAESIVESVRRAELGVPFEVVYYPRIGSTEFLVPATNVDEAMAVPWSVGTRVRMGIDSEDMLRKTWFQGTVSGFSHGENEMWSHAPWRALQITFDEPNALPHIKNVNPWQVESLPLIPQLQGQYSTSKKIGIPQVPELFNDGGSNTFFPMTGIGNTMAEGLKFPSTGPKYSPAGMQGARHSSLCVSSFLNSGIDPQQDNDDSATKKDIDVSVSLNLGSSSQSDSLAPLSQGSIYSSRCVEDFHNLLVKDKNVTALSFKLFGQTIQLKPSVGAAADDIYIDSDKGDENTKGASWTSNFSRKRKRAIEDDDVFYLGFKVGGSCYQKMAWLHA